MNPRAILEALALAGNAQALASLLGEEEARGNSKPKGGDEPCRDDREAIPDKIEPLSKVSVSNAEPTSNPEGSATPRTDAAVEEWNMGPLELTTQSVEADFARTLERENIQLRAAVDSAKRDVSEWFQKWERNETEKINLRADYERVVAHLFANDSDSPVAACNCLTKTPEIQYHKKGCKYRLVMERDESKDKCKQTAKDFETAFRLVRLENDALRAERDSLQKQVEMDTECIERIRANGMQMEAERDKLREGLKQCVKALEHCLGRVDEDLCDHAISNALTAAHTLLAPE